MNTHELPVLIEPVAWRSGLAGEFPGQESYREIGSPPVRMIFCWCPPTPPGQPAILGSPPDEPERDDDEKQHPVEFPQGFWIAKHPVNQQQWHAVVKTKPNRSERGKGDLHPVDSVSWRDAQEFCRNAGLRLPTDDEWEYACRAGSATPFGIGAGHDLNAQIANFDGNHPYGSGRAAFKWLYRRSTLAQGSFPPNAWGLHDLHGQLWEWCADEIEGRARALRGGSWFNDGRDARSASRCRRDPGFVSSFFGFRPCPSSTPGKARTQAGGRGKSAAERGKE